MEKTCVADSITPQWIIVGLGNPGSAHKLNIKIGNIKYHALSGF